MIYLQDDPPTPAQHVAGLISGSASSRGMSVVRPVMVRIPLHHLMTVDAMAELAGKSRSHMVVHLVEVGINSVLDELNDDTRKRLNEVVSRVAAKLLEESGANESDEVA